MRLIMKKNILAALILSTLAVQAHATAQLNVWEDIKKSSGIKDAVADFEKQYDVKVNVQETPYAQQLEKLRLDGPAGIGPDVLVIPNDQLGGAVVQGLLTPLNLEAKQTEQYTPASINAFKMDNALYGVPKAVAESIFDEISRFAAYAFNKSHAAAYAVVSYQTAYLKYYYPVEFMAALMTSVIDFPNKVAEYILVCRQMGIKILPPDVNCGMYGFSVDNGAIRYGLSAIKSVGRPVIESLVREREENGQYRSLKDFMERNSPQMNKRAVENFIKAGALDCLDGNRRQKMLVYQKISDSISQDKKNSLAGQMSLFDLVSEEDKKEFEIRMPDVEEFGKEELLGYEKEVLGIYLSGHPLENYREMMEKTISAKTSDFQQDEETNLPKVMDGQKVIIGGMITDKTIKYTKNNKVMAFLTVEDLVGTVEVVVFPRDYEKSQQFLNEEGRVFIQGRVSAEDDRASKLILEKIRPFDNMPREIWIQFDNKESYTQQSQELLADLRRSPGDSAVVIYLKDVKAIKKLPVGYHAQIQDSWLNYMYEKYGKTNVKVVERGLKNL